MMKPYNLYIRAISEPYSEQRLDDDNTQPLASFESITPFPAYQVGDTISEAMTELGIIKHIEHEVGYIDRDKEELMHVTTLFVSQPED